MSRKESQNKNKRGFFEYLAIKTELPSDIISGGFRLEIRGRNTLFMNGCKRIIKYSEEEMIFSVDGYFVRVSGNRLICSCYHNGTVCIEGVIDKFEFDDGKRVEI